MAGNRPLKVLQTDSPQRFQEAVLEAAALLKAGQLVALPTETVYGLAANALNPDAVARIFEAKGRPPNNPIIVHIASLEMARACVRAWPELADRLARAFWPGPLTLVLPRAPVIPDVVTAGGQTVGIRWPSHPFIQAVIRECGFPIAAPSANPSNRLSPTNAAHVARALAEKVPLVVDGGQSQVGIESTVLDLSVQPPVVLRPGMIDRRALLAVTGELRARAQAAAPVLKSPGLLKKHYAPRARLVLWEWRDTAELENRLAAEGIKPRKVHVIAHTRIPGAGKLGRVAVIPHDAEAFARALYAELHESDRGSPKLIVVEALPPGPEWHAIADRLARAAAD